MEMEGHEAGKRSASITMDLRTPLGSRSGRSRTYDKRDFSAIWGQIRNNEYVPPYGVHKSDPVIRAFRNAIRDCGGTPRVLAKQGTCDFNVLSPWGCHMGAYGPGNSIYDHSSNEQITYQNI